MLKGCGDNVLRAATLLRKYLGTIAKPVQAISSLDAG
jgi:hypothetical protein